MSSVVLDNSPTNACPLRINNLLDEGNLAIAKGSLSFALASKLLSRRMRHAVVLLYHWCRTCDDRADQLPRGTSQVEREQVINELAMWTQESRSRMESVPTAFAGMGWIINRYSIPLEYPLELLEGMRSDLFHQPLRDERELHLYCYRVAGTVGLMFAHISGVSDAAALRIAADLGTAMQMTNIARDVFEDFKMGRIYLPHTWLAEEGIDPSRLTSTQQRNALVRVVRRLLELAELHYRSADAGLRYLPLRSALAVAAARHIYAEIGCQIQEKGLDAWEQRCWVRLPRKLFLVMRAMIQVARLVPERIVRPFRPVSIQHIWRFQWPTPRH